MHALERIDSPNPAVRAIERWKRGAGVAIMAALGLLPGVLAGAAAAFIGEWIGGDTLAAIVGALAFVIVAPWALGQRLIVRQIGKLAEVADS
jgi:hypothetical protein